MTLRKRQLGIGKHSIFANRQTIWSADLAFTAQAAVQGHAYISILEPRLLANVFKRAARLCKEDCTGPRHMDPRVCTG